MRGVADEQKMFKKGYGQKWHLLGAYSAVLQFLRINFARHNTLFRNLWKRVLLGSANALLSSTLITPRKICRAANFCTPLECGHVTRNFFGTVRGIREVRLAFYRRNLISVRKGDGNLPHFWGFLGHFLAFWQKSKIDQGKIKFGQKFYEQFWSKFFGIYINIKWRCSAPKI